MAHWFSIEVLDGTYSSAGWVEAFADALVTEAFGRGARDWDWHRHGWGTVFEVAFDSEDAWLGFLAALAVRAALDAAPDPLTGVIIYRGRGGSAGQRQPRRPRPLLGSGCATIPLPLGDEPFELFPAAPRRLLALG